MTQMKNFTLTFDTVRLGVALVALVVLATKLHSIDSDLASKKANSDHDVAVAADHASRACSGVADDQPIEVSIGQTIVTPHGEKLSCTRDRVMVYSRA